MKKPLLLIALLVSVVSFAQLPKLSPRQVLGWADVKDFGATGDGVTNDATAIQSAIDYIFAKGGGTVYFPNGVYYVGASTITIPFTDYSASTTATTIKLLGESAPPNVFDPLSTSARYLSNKGVIIQSNIPAGSSGSVIKALGTGGVSWLVLNFTQLNIENITVRVNGTGAGGAVAGAKDTAINAYGLTMMELNHVRVDVACSNDSIAQPASTSVGIIGPSTNNWVKNDYNDVWCIGQYKGVVAYEHSNFDNTYFDACYYGLVSPGTNHSIHGNRMGFWRTRTAIKIEGTLTPAITIDQYNNERNPSTGKWFDFVADMEEANPGYASGHIRYFTVHGSYDFVRTNPAGSRIFSTPTFGNGYKWTTANRPQSADSGTVGLNTTTGHMEFKPLGTSDGTYNILAHIGQSRNWYTGTSGVLTKWGLNGNPNADPYQFNIYDSTGAASNMMNFYTTFSTMKVANVNTAGAAYWLLQKAGVSKWQYGMDFAANGTSDFYLYDHANSKARLYLNAGDVHIGGNAYTAPALTIKDNGAIGVNGSFGTSGQVLTSAGTGAPPTWTTISSGGVTGSATTNQVAYWSGSGAIAGRSSFTDDGTTVSIKPATYNTSNYHFRVGDFVTQNYSLNNTFFADNAYYNGGSWTKINTGYTAGFQFYNGQTMFLNHGSSTGSFTPTYPAKIDNTGTVALGGDIVNTPGSYTGSTLVVSSTKLTLNQTPATYSSGGRSMLVRNTTTGDFEIETVPSSGTTTNALSIASELHSGGATSFDGSAAISLAIQAGSVTNSMLAGSIDLTKISGSIGTTPFHLTGNPANNGTLWATSTGSQNAIWAENTSTGSALTAISTNGGSHPLFLERDGTATNDVQTMITTWRTGGTIANNFGSQFANQLETSDGTIQDANFYRWYWTNATTANRTSNTDIYCVNNAATVVAMNIQPNGVIRVNNNADTLATKADVRDGVGVYKVSGSDVSNTSTTLATITGLVSGTLAVSTLYEVDILIDANSSSTAGGTYAIVLGGTGTGGFISLHLTATTSTTAATTQQLSTSGTASSAVMTLNGEGTVRICGYVKTNSSGTPTITVQQAKTTSGTIIARIGSRLKIKPA